ncbi:hypothetical protein T484DRAFT_1859997 [Baffinella frigidus]|nr:hypothetical protein T484DRAFT_1859997 [Cryptophyta sp. CCMP2293]
MVIGENISLAYAKTDSAALDLFFSVVPDIDPSALVVLLEAAWQEDPTTALRLIFQTGNVREGGKLDRGNFYRSLVWLWHKSPATLLFNIRAIPEHTCLKDLLAILVFVMHGRTEDDPRTLLRVEAERPWQSSAP